MPDDLWLLFLIATIAFLGSLVYGMSGFGAGLDWKRALLAWEAQR